MRTMRIAILPVLLIWLTGCATTGPRGEQSLILIDTATEIQMGMETHQGIVQEFPLHDDPELAAYVAEVGARVAAHSDRRDVEYTFTVLDHEMLNAFAAPGGFVYVTTGLLAAAGDESELAGVLAHEVGHVVGRHSVRQIQQAMGLQLAAQLILGDRQSEAWGQLAGLGAGLFMMKNSRDHEHQSDDFGVKYTVAAGYDPYGLVRFFETMIATYGTGEGGVAGWMSTHPTSESRIEEVREEIAVYGVSPGQLARERERYLARTASLRN